MRQLVKKNMFDSMDSISIQINFVILFTVPTVQQLLFLTRYYARRCYNILYAKHKSNCKNMH